MTLKLGTEVRSPAQLYLALTNPACESDDLYGSGYRIAIDHTIAIILQNISKQYFKAILIG